MTDKNKGESFTPPWMDDRSEKALLAARSRTSSLRSNVSSSAVRETRAGAKAERGATSSQPGGPKWDGYGLFERLTAPRALDIALDRVAQNGGAAGSDRQSIAQFQAQATSALLRLSTDMRQGAYRPEPVRQVSIPKPSGGTRTLSIPTVRDRIAQTSASILLMPLLEEEFEASSFGYRPGRSVDMAVRRVSALHAQGFEHVVDADIEDYFNSVPHDPLLRQLEALFGDSALTQLLGLWLESWSGRIAAFGRGLAQGSPISPLLANLYLDGLDEALDGRSTRIVRYADDFLICCKSAAGAERARDLAAKQLSDLGLMLNLEKTRITSFDDGFRFLGHRFVKSLVLKSPNSEFYENPDLVDALRLIEARDKKLAADEATQRAARSAGYKPRFRHLYLLEAGRSLSERNGTFIVTEADGERELVRVHARQLDRIEIGPRCEISTDALRAAAEMGIEVALVTQSLDTTATLTAPRDRARIVAKQAAAVVNPQKRFNLAYAIVRTRQRNQRALLRRLNRTAKSKDIESELIKLNRAIRGLEVARTVPELLGHEGKAAAFFWAGFRLSLRTRMGFRKRVRHPAADPVNLALNSASALLERDCSTFLRRAGLHPGIGCLHSSADNHDALVYDFMEEFRAPMIESLVVSMINKRNLIEGDFVEGIKKEVRYSESGQGKIIKAYEAQANRPIKDPQTGVKTTWRGLIEDQAFRLRAALCDGGDYVPYEMDY